MHFKIRLFLFVLSLNLLFQWCFPFHLLAGSTFGFNGKPVDEESELYFYGGRYYNPALGRFITADSLVQSPESPQTLNRYSYCNNNPVNLTDPTGHSWKKFWKGIANFFEDNWKTVVTVAAGIGVGIFTGGIGLNFYTGLLGSAKEGILASAMTSGAIAGAASGAIGAGLNGQDILQSVLMGAGIGMATAGFMQAEVFKPVRDTVAKFTNPVYRLAEGSLRAMGQATNVLTGGMAGKFWDGFQSVWNYLPNKAFDQQVKGKFALNKFGEKWGINIYSTTDPYIIQKIGPFALGTNVVIPESIINSGLNIQGTQMTFAQVLSHEMSHGLVNKILGPAQVIYGATIPLANVAAGWNGQSSSIDAWQHAVNPFEHIFQSYPGIDL